MSETEEFDFGKQLTEIDYQIMKNKADEIDEFRKQFAATSSNPFSLATDNLRTSTLENSPSLIGTQRFQDSPYRQSLLITKTTGFKLSQLP